MPRRVIRKILSFEEYCKRDQAASNNTSSEIGQPLVPRSASLHKIKMLGKGAFGQVYQGMFDSIPVCIKTSPLSQTIMCRHEANLLKKFATTPELKCPKFHALIEQSDELCLVMEQLGESLEQIKRQTEDSRLSNIEHIKWVAYKLLSQLRILHVLHEYIHGDIKPDNVLFNLEKTELYMIDFGFSTQISKHPQPTAIRGTIRFMSPHIHNRESPSPRDDLFSLGYTLLYLYLGGLPWDNICLQRDKMTREELHKLLYEAKHSKFYTHQLPHLPQFFQNYFTRLQAASFDTPIQYADLIFNELPVVDQEVHKTQANHTTTHERVF